MPAAVYSAKHLTKIYPGNDRKANDDLTFEIHEGEVFGLLGPNGAGKSTLVSQLAGLLKPTSGSIRLYGIDVVAHPEAVADYVALQPQGSSAVGDLYPHEAIYHTGRFRGLTSAEARRQTGALLEELNLAAIGRRAINQLSGGQRKLVTLALAFVGDRPVMIFDEPTNELDPEIRRVVWEKLQALNRRGTTILLVTHNVLEAERVIQRVGIVSQGRLMALGTPGELKARVDQRVRLELLFKTDDETAPAMLARLGEARPLTRRHWTVLCHREGARDSIDQVLGRIGLDRLDDFRILTPSLEDVYLQLGGGAKLA
ncbi:MAG: putative transporter ATPase and permease protein [Symbiobacteriaceae bacterium]|jgi:ABC-type multidrug transport system ATPase subunit|nr:putative transporter ATPase and permease protein [Symbiobacteriaceae bacterium]